MIATSRILAAVAAFAALAASSAQAQTLIGSRYVSGGYSISKLDGASSVDVESYSGMANVPVTRWLDLRAGYGYGKLDDSEFSFRSDEEAIWAGALLYNTVGEYKAFTEISVGYDWVDAKFQGVKDSDETALVGLTIGGEFPVSPRFSFTPWLDYTHFLNDLNLYGTTIDSYGIFSIGVSGHLRVTSMIGVGAGFSIDEDSDYSFSFRGTLTF